VGIQRVEGLGLVEALEHLDRLAGEHMQPPAQLAQGAVEVAQALEQKP
jgi:hypothetical protein